jgi:sugar phosphate isomerase/epimerase
MNKVGAVSLGWSGTPLHTVFNKLAEMGGECIEINSRTERHHNLVLNAETLPQIRQWAADSRVIIGSLSGYSNFALADADARQREIDQLVATCRHASELGVRIVRAFTGNKPQNATAEQLRPQIVAAFQTAGHAAEKLGVTLAIENHGHLFNDGPGLASLITEIGQPNVRVTLDTGNFSWAGHNLEQTLADFKAVLPHTANVHVKDGIWRDDSFEFVAAGAGSLQINQLVSDLKHMGYDGPVYSEYEGDQDFETNTRLSIAFLRQAVRV